MDIKLFIVIGLFLLMSLLSIYIIFLYNLAKKSMSWPSITGKIDHCKVRVSTGNSDYNTWSMDLSYSYIVSLQQYHGKRYFFGSTIAGIPTREMLELEKKFNEKKEILITYKLDDPQTATIFPGIHKNLQIALSIIIFFWGGSFLLLLSLIIK